jgi:hypothetical protein
MTFLAPIFLAAGAAVAAVVVLLHFLARRRPRSALLPTARFVPDRPARWPSRAPRPTDWLLLAARVLAILAMAAAFAGPVRQPDRAVTSRVVLVDRSRAVADPNASRDSALAVARDGDLVIAFDTSVRVISAPVHDTAGVLGRSVAQASLSSALIAAERAAVALRDRADSLELVIVSPFATEAWDDATSTIRARWQGRARLIAVPLLSADSAPRGIVIQTPRSDPVSAAVAPFAAAPEASARVVRADPTTADSTWARATGHVLVHWPRSADRAMLTAEGVAGPGVVLAAPLVRRMIDATEAHVVARYADGSPAIVERTLGAGCVRDVGFDLPVAGDVALRESVRRLVQLVAAPCAGSGARRVISAQRMDTLRGFGALLPTSALPRPAESRSGATSWLLIVAALLLLLEVALRQRVASA